METLPDGPERFLVEKIYEGIAAVESAKTSIRSKRGMHGNALKCHHNGVAVFGYDRNPDGSYSINDEQAAIVREAFTRRRHGENEHSIAQDFALRDVKTTKGNVPNRTFVDAMLHNEKYAGVYKFGDVRIEGGMPSIITMDLFERVSVMQPRKIHKNEDFSDYVLSQRVFCSECGRPMPGSSCRNHANVKYEYYRCRHCGKSVRADWLHSTIASGIREMLSSRENAAKIARRALAMDDAGHRDARIKSLKASKAKAEAGLKNIMDAIEQGIMLPNLQQRIDGLQRQLEEAELQLAEAQNMYVIDVDDFTAFLMAGMLMDDEALVDAFVAKCMVEDGTVYAILNYRDEKGAPAKVDLNEVRLSCSWLPG